MTAQNVDVVLAIDASNSMQPCFEGVRQHIQSLIEPLQGPVARIRFGMVALNALCSGHKLAYKVALLGGASWPDLYTSRQAAGLFSERPSDVRRALADITPEGNENTLLALDFALDHPFGPVHNTRRVVVLLSDEPIETGAEGRTPCAKIPELVEKLNQRRVKLFMALPNSPAGEVLEEANGCEFEAVQGGAGLASVDFRRLFEQMGKSISMSALQSSDEHAYQRALFGQDRWQNIDAAGWSTDD